MTEPLLTWKGRRVRSPGDGPEAAARKVPEAPRPGSLFFVPSPLEGWGLETLLARLPAAAAVVFLEKDAELEDRCREGWTEWLGPLAADPRLFRLDSDDEAAVQRLFRRLPLSQLRRCEFLPLNGAWLSQGPRYREVFARLEQGLTRHWANRMTTLHLGPLWVRNLFDNLRTIEAFRPWPQWDRDPVMVLGAGSSLEKSLPWIEENRSRLRLVAVDTALPVLRARGILPDAAVCVEAQHANLRDFAGWAGKPVTLFADLSSFPGGNRVFAEPPCWFASRFAELSLWDRWPWPKDTVPIIPPLGSVGVAAVWVAWRLTSGPVLLSGLDFAYPAGKTHARGAPALGALAATTHRLRPMEQAGSWANERTRPATGGWLTTPVLEGYGAVLRDQAAAERHRTWVWAPAGLDLGLGVWDRPLSAPLGPVRRSAASISPLAWLGEEVARWQGLVERFTALNQGAPEALPALRDAIRDLDYLTFAFPDPGFRAETDWLSRVLVQARWLLDRARGS